MAATVAQRNAAFDAAKALLMQIIANEAGFFASTIKGDIKDADILQIVDAVLNAAASASG
jgi:hypothetical protein